MALRHFKCLCVPSRVVSVNREISSNSKLHFAKVDQYDNHQKPDWNRAVSDAEKIVGYPTSFLNLRWLLNDEVANVALHLPKLVGSNHPLLKTVKGLFYNGRNNMQAWGLIVLLLSKAAGHTSKITDLEQDKAAGVLHSQRALAEITEMIRTSHLVHQGLVNIQCLTVDDNSTSDLIFGNKIALLGGDYLLAYSCAQLAALRNQEVTHIVSSAIRDMSEGEFVGPRDKQNNPLPARPQPDLPYKLDDLFCREPLVVDDTLGNAKAEWTSRHILSGASLLGKSCQGTLKLAGHTNNIQEQGYLFGKHLALAWQACLDRDPFTAGSTGPFSLVCAPVMFHLQQDPNLYQEIEKGLDDVSNVDYDLLRKAILDGPALAQTQKLQIEHSQYALDVVKQLDRSDARTALENIIAAIQNI